MSMRVAGAIAIAALLAAGAALAQTPVPIPVPTVAEARLPIGAGMLPVVVSRDWSRPLPEIHRAVIVVHGYGREGPEYAQALMKLGPPADTLVIAPQFLAPEDIDKHRLPDTILRWNSERWAGGGAADGPEPTSALDALDAVLAKLGDRALLPNLSDVVLAGFSAGGQLAQRYAVVGKGGFAFGEARLGIRLRFVVGSPSSYVYFTDQRGFADGSIAPYDAAKCSGFNRWRYGFAGDLPAYVAAVLPLGLAGIERRYAERDVVYLVGANDNDPAHRMLDKSCAAEAQGANRLARMQRYFAMLEFREGRALAHRMQVIPGAAHNATQVFGSACGRAALFGAAGCPDIAAAEEKK